jgi:hypothetical protein
VTLIVVLIVFIARTIPTQSGRNATTQKQPVEVLEFCFEPNKYKYFSKMTQNTKRSRIKWGVEWILEALHT